jgi:hypothetical protein
VELRVGSRTGSAKQAALEMERYSFSKLYLLTYLLSYSMEQSPSWKANRFADSQEIPPHFMEPEGSLPHSQVPATCLYPEPAQSSTYPLIPLPEDPSFLMVAAIYSDNDKEKTTFRAKNRYWQYM